MLLGICKELAVSGFISYFIASVSFWWMDEWSIRQNDVAKHYYEVGLNINKFVINFSKTNFTIIKSPKTKATKQKVMIVHITPLRGGQGQSI